VGDIIMNLEFIKQVNEYVIEAILETDDHETLALIDQTNWPSQIDLNNAKAVISQKLATRQKQILAQNKAEFQAYKKDKNNFLEMQKSSRTVTEMLSDIVKSMQNKDTVPEGILMAFRDQGQAGSDDDIKRIWKALVELGVIDPNKDDKKS
jgi:hypothetical protein